MTQCDLEMVIFDLDDTLIKTYGKSIYVFNFVEALLKYLTSKKIKIGLASYNTNAKIILESLNLVKYFDIIEYEDWLIKLDFKETMLKKIINETNIPCHKVLLIDDHPKCIDTAKYLGLNTSLIQHGNIKNCLKQYINIDHLEY